jgi:hypothetical protein
MSLGSGGQTAEERVAHETDVEKLRAMYIDVSNDRDAFQKAAIENGLKVSYLNQEILRYRVALGLIDDCQGVPHVIAHNALNYNNHTRKLDYLGNK